MPKSLVFTVIGPDRPGLVEKLAACVEARGGNWEQGQFQALDGQFAGLLRVSLAPERVESLRAALEALPDVTAVVAESVDGVGAPTRLIDLDLVGADRSGIVHQVSRALAGLEVNIRHLESWTERAAMSGEPTFRAKGVLEVPPSVSEAALRRHLEAIANELMVEIGFTDPAGEVAA